MSTPFHNAAIQGRTEKVLAFLKKGTDVDLRDDDNATALSFAAFRNRLDIVKILLAHGADVNAANRVGYSALMAASREGHTEVVRELLKHGALTEARMENGATALHIAAGQSRDVATITVLIEAGADVESRDDGGGTPIMDAAHFGKLEIVQELLRHNANPAAVMDDGRTVPGLAEARGHHEIAALLRELGA